MRADELPVVDLGDRAFWSDIHTPLADALARSPVAATPDGGRIVLGGAAAEAFLRDPRSRTVDLLARGGITDGPLHDWWSRVMFSTDPPEHTRLRSLVSRAFTPRRAEAMRERVAAIVDDLLAPHLARGRIELIDDLAHLVPIRVMSELLDVPAGDHDRFARWTADLGLVFSSIVDPSLRAHLETTVVALDGYVRTLIDERRAHPGRDLLSDLVAAEEHGDRLSEDELVAMVMNLLFAGHDTTRSLLQIALALLASKPDRADALRRSPQAAPAVVEEVLRFEPPVFGSARAPVADVDVGGVVLEAGRPVSIALPAGNRDPARYREPHRFEPDRWNATPPPPAVLSFGQGVHYCLGAALARVEAQVTIPRVVAALPDLALECEPTWVPYASIRRFEALPATFTPR